MDSELGTLGTRVCAAAVVDELENEVGDLWASDVSTS